ncbi:OmpP1/FadL family transporter [Mangrovivirga cuniculi]|uniref:Outer membrane protein transport protein (OMPP1/FadL/TodX) n=1 Tax=Mangrovivirga cuniculi TaxID=2715131 RepID=A0A4D7JWE3_9BACT|nr:outer membrane protein transport protein [Mangrovivirga cuniculi]QCK16466.1 hypothetical protein DCC35_17895 [Mangrovivirga cuniculi]
MISLNKLYLTLLFLIFSIPLSAQTYVEIVEKAANTEISGTARMQALGGAQVSLGGDISSIYSNPAGLGFFNQSNFGLTGGFNFLNSKANFYGNDTEDSDFRFNTPTLGAVFQNDGKSNSIIKSQGFGLSVTSTAIYDQTEYFTASNPQTDFSGDFYDYIYSIYDQNSFSPEFQNTLPELAYNAYLVDEDNLGLYYIEGTYYPSLPASITYSSDTRGQNSSFNLAYGININDRVYLGAGLNFNFYSFTTETFYTETRSEDALATLNYNQFIDVNGGGISGTFGIIARPVNNMTVGLSYQTRTSYRMNDYAEILVQGIFNNYEYDTGEETIILNNETAIQAYESEYRFSTPGKLRVGATYLFGKKGFITADVEHINYAGMSLRSGSNIDFSDDNNFIENNYESVWNFRTGIEYRLSKAFYLRGGYANYASPMENDENTGATSIYSGGLGYRSSKGFYIDLTYQNKSQTGVNRSPFTIAEPYATDLDRNAPTATIDRSTSSILVTMGKAF